MNKRIKDLERARFIVQDENGKAPYDKWRDKFAELIVRECIGQIALIGISNFENKDIRWTVDTAIANIKEHFGIEE